MEGNPNIGIGPYKGLKNFDFSAKMTIQHNNANVLCLGSRVIGEELAKSVLDAFLSAKFEGGRHLQRVIQLDQLCDI